MTTIIKDTEYYIMSIENDSDNSKILLGLMINTDETLGFRIQGVDFNEEDFSKQYAKSFSIICDYFMHYFEDLEEYEKASIIKKTLEKYIK